MTKTYTETVYRYVVEYHEELPESHKAQLRLNGIDPDQNWCLKWSFQDKESAEQQLAEEIQQHKDICARLDTKNWKTFRVRDLGETQYIERVAWF